MQAVSASSTAIVSSLPAFTTVSRQQARSIQEQRRRHNKHAQFGSRELLANSLDAGVLQQCGRKPISRVKTVACADNSAAQQAVREDSSSVLKWVSALSTAPDWTAAMDELATSVISQTSTNSYDVGFLFVTTSFAFSFQEAIDHLAHKLKIKQLIGCVGGGVVGAQQELEMVPGASLCVGNLPADSQVKPFFLTASSMPDLDSRQSAWYDALGFTPQPSEPPPAFVLFATPDSPVAEILQGLDFAFPGSTKIGGLTVTPTLNIDTLFVDGELKRGGVAGLIISGNVEVASIVAQGCRPVGQIHTITKASKNVILELDGKPAVQSIIELLERAESTDKQLIRSALFTGIVRDEFTTEPAPGDYLIRQLLGLVRDNGALVVGDYVRTGQRLRFHVRDAQTSREDISTLLARFRSERALSASVDDTDLSSQQQQPIGALMFACTGRGVGLYGEADFDTRTFHQLYPNVPMAGAFVNGEIGPVGSGAFKQTFLHGFTSVVALVYPRGCNNVEA